MATLISLPGFARGIAVNGYGYYLNWLRYGQATERLVEEALEREHWSKERWQSWLDDRTATILHLGATVVPYYREYWNNRRRSGDRSAWDQLSNWPILGKEEVRRDPRAFLADAKRPRFLVRDSTSGTTGTPISFRWSRSTLQRWYALFEARWRRWYGLSRADRWANIGGRLVAEVDRRRPPYWVWNSSMNQLYLSSYHISAFTIKDYCAAISTYGIKYLYGYSSSIHSLALALRNSGVSPPPIACVLTNAEPLFEHQRETIRTVLGCPVRATYGMTEMVAAASECEQERLHQWPEVGIIERQADGGRHPASLFTGLHSEETILIRYELGDVVTAADHSETCRCGRTLPVLSMVEGRTDDMLRTRDGRWIGRLDPVFKGDMPVQEAQIIQESLDELKVLVVPSDGFTQRHEQELKLRIAERMGDGSITIKRVRGIDRGPNGKFRAVISRLPHHGSSAGA